MAGGEDRPLQRPHGALKLRRLLTVDLHAQGGPDLTHTLKGRLLGGNDGIDLPHAEIGQKVGLVDRTLGVPDIGKLGSCIRDGSRWRAFSDQFAQSFGRLLSGGGQVAFQFFARLSEGDAIALPLGWRAVRKHGNPGGTDARLRSEEHTSELQSLMRISYAVFCLKKKKKKPTNTNMNTQTDNRDRNINTK